MAQLNIEVDDRVYKVANRLRQSYYEDWNKTLESSSHPLQWIRMAEAAIQAGIEFDEHELRVELNRALAETAEATNDD